jgi:uncharacterized linocin/CFP29 family protein
MTSNNPQVPWTDEQWARINQVVQEEAGRARVAATFLPLFGPLPANTDFVREESVEYGEEITIADRKTIQLPTLQAKVHVRGAQMADPEMSSVLALFRRAANVLARLEDAVIFNGQPNLDAPPAGPPNLENIWEMRGGQRSRGLFAPDIGPTVPVRANGPALVTAVSNAIGQLEENGHFGPFAVVLGKDLFLAVQTPDGPSLVLPQDCIIPFLGGGSLLRSSTLPDDGGVVVALGGAPVELVVATDMSLSFLQVTTDPIFVFRVFEKIALRIKEPSAIMALVPPPAPRVSAASRQARRRSSGGK